MVFLGHRFIPLIKLALQNFQQLADKLEPQLTHSFGKIIHCSFVPTTFVHVDVKLDLKIKVNVEYLQYCGKLTWLLIHFVQHRPRIFSQPLEKKNLMMIVKSL